jgi:hypothetical protein
MFHMIYKLTYYPDSAFHHGSSASSKRRLSAPWARTKQATSPRATSKRFRQAIRKTSTSSRPALVMLLVALCRTRLVNSYVVSSFGSQVVITDTIATRLATLRMILPSHLPAVKRPLDFCSKHRHGIPHASILWSGTGANKHMSMERGINTRLWTYFASALQLSLTILLYS